MKNYLKQYRLLADHSIVAMYDLNRKQTQDFLLHATAVKIDKFTFHKDNTSDAIMFYDTDDGNGILYENTAEFNRVVSVGTKPVSNFFAFTPSPDDFLTRRNDYIEELMSNLNLDGGNFDFTIDSIREIERNLQMREYEHAQDILQNFLGILAYTGESVCRSINGKWHIKKELPANKYCSWVPYIEDRSGKIMNTFADLFEGLLLYDRETSCYVPVITIKMS